MILISEINIILHNNHTKNEHLNESGKEFERGKRIERTEQTMDSHGGNAWFAADFWNVPTVGMSRDMPFFKIISQ